MKNIWYSASMGGHDLSPKPSFQHVVLWNRTNGCLLPPESKAIEAWSFLDGSLLWGSRSICSSASFAMVAFPLPLQPVVHIAGSLCFIFSSASVLIGLMSYGCSSILGPVPHLLSFPSFWTVLRMKALSTRGFSFHTKTYTNPYTYT